ncbi:MarR family winged helix-turn-helix transcriptional regulator [Sneathiella chinensis]|uniref:MarR family transcriptional regulator n=1 Tax=Sneathiella chinensis TaxID=349750 RepID=A0ABQ5U166_9PROT|nr:MarR family transcriptional regulator [Sneathiella chinensis]GLQ05416.1 MarR family transcriptional regulator [Sneathiella chinensis]
MDGQNTTQAILKLWQQSLNEMVRRSGPDLSSRQMAIMLMVYLDEPPHTVRGIASQLNISKPAVTRALDALGKMDLLRRKPDDKDKRSINVVRTVKGSVFLSEFSEIIEKSAWKNLT